MNLSKGDRVKFLNETGEGIVIEQLDNEMILVETEDGFEMKYPINQLIKVNPDEEEDYFEHTEPKDMRQASLQKDAEHRSHHYMLAGHLKPGSRGGSSQIAEIDLHIEEITHRPASLKAGEKLSIQLDYAQKCLKEAFELKVPVLVFIHGVGEGVLRSELRKIFMNYPQIDYFDASFSEYGAGATEVRIKGLYAS